MKKYTIIRTSPTTGTINQLMENGEVKVISNDWSYGKCLDWVIEHQRELKVFKVARILDRKNAKRRLMKSFYTEDKKEAIRLFDELDDVNVDATYQLLTGDWQIIAHFMVVGGQRGMTIID